jgi:replicative DNA helicase
LNGNLYQEQLEAAEKSVVGSVFIDPNAFELTGLSHKHFFDVRLATIWDAMAYLREAKQPVDEVTLASQLGTKLDAVGGYSFLSELALATPTAANVQHYADLVREGWLTRRVKLVASDIVTRSCQGIIGEDLLATLQSGIEGILKESGKSPGNLYDVAQEQIALIGGTTIPRGLYTGLNLEEIVPGGIPRDKVTVIFADAGTFKTTAKNHMLISMAESGAKVLDISLEDSTELTAHRYISRLTGIPYGRIAGGVLTQDEKDRITALSPEAMRITKRLYTGDEVNPHIKDIVRTARQLQYSSGLDAVAVDYIQLLDGHGAKETLDEAVRTAQLAAKRDRIAYIFLSQIKQDVIGRENPRPRLQDMLGSSAMRTGAKLAIGLFRPYSHCPNPVCDGGPYAMYAKFNANYPGGQELYPNILEMWVVKNVLGPAGQAVHLLVQPETGQILPFREEMKPYL